MTDILVYQLPFPLFCNFVIDIFKHVILRLIFLHITYSYSFHCILHHIFYWLLFPTPSIDRLVLASFSFVTVGFSFIG